MSLHSRSPVRLLSYLRDTSRSVFPFLSTHCRAAYESPAMLQLKLCALFFLLLLLFVDSFFVNPPFLSQQSQYKSDVNANENMNTNIIAFSHYARAATQLQASIGVDPALSFADAAETSKQDLLIESYTLRQLGPVDSRGNRVLYRVSTKDNSITATITQLKVNAVPRVRIYYSNKMLNSLTYFLTP